MSAALTLEVATVPARISDATRQRIAELARSGESCASIARELGLSRSSVSTIARQMVSEQVFERSATKTATAARQTDIRASMASLAEKLTKTAHTLHDDLYRPSLVYAFGGRENDYNEHLLAQPDAKTRRELLTSIAIAVDKVRVIEQFQETGSSGRAAVVRLVDSLADAVENA